MAEKKGMTEWLNEAEIRLVEATRVGGIATLSPDETVRAEVVQALATRHPFGELEVWPSTPDGVRINGGHILGRLDLASCAINEPLEIYGVDVADGIDLSDARTRTLNFSRSRFGGGGEGPALCLQSTNVDGGVLLLAATVEGACDLSFSHVAGQFNGNDSIFKNLSGPSIAAFNAQIDGGMFLDRTTIVGRCDIRSAAILQFSACGATFATDDGMAIVAHSARVEGNFALNKSAMRGCCDISGAHLGGQFNANEAHFKDAAQFALRAEHAHLDGGMFLRATTVIGGCNIFGITIRGLFAAEQGYFVRPEGMAITAETANISGNMNFNRSRIVGGIDIRRASIGGALLLNGAFIESRKNIAIWAYAATIGDVFARKLKDVSGYEFDTIIIGMLHFVSSTVRGDVEFSGARLTATHHLAVMARGISVGGNLNFIAGTIVLGGILLSKSTVLGEMSARGARIVSAAQARVDPAILLARPPDIAPVHDDTPWTHHAIGLFEARIGILVMPATRATRPRGIVNLSSAKVGTFFDYAEAWPDPIDSRNGTCETRHRDDNGSDVDHLVLDGFEYEHLYSARGNSQGGKEADVVEARTRWLYAQSRQDVFAHLKPQPWQQLSKVLAAHGYEDEARQIAIQQRVALRRVDGTSFSHYFLSFLLHYVADYGFRPWKTVGWSVMTVFLFSYVFFLFAYHTCGLKEPVCADHRAFVEEKDRENSSEPAKLVFKGRDERAFVRTLPADFVPAIQNVRDAEETLQQTYPAFNSLLYSLDAFLPLLNLGTEPFWRPNENLKVNGLPWGTILQWLYVLEQIIGAILISLVITGFTGLLTRGGR